LLAVIRSAALLGVQGIPVDVEVHVGQGLPAFTVVGLPDASCREARDRARAAILSSRLKWPQQRITVNLAPSGLRKEGPGFDLAIALGVLVASGQLAPAAVAGLGVVGELGLDGSVRRVPGVLPLVAAMARPRVAVAASAAEEAALVCGVWLGAVDTLAALVAALAGTAPWPDPPPARLAANPPPTVDIAEIRGQPRARLAATVAAAGGHHLLLVGPPGAGKTMLARAVSGLLPALEPPLAMEVTAIHSAAGLELPAGGLVRRPPLRAPHHTSSMISLVGGGSARLRPGEISCAHGGVLFMDELAEFAPSTLDALRQPLEDGVVRVSRAHGALAFPARFLLVAAMNPCPCGRFGDGEGCVCGDAAVLRYQRRISGPLLDRFDLRLHVARPPAEDLLAGRQGPGTSEQAERVDTARERARARGVRANVELSPDALTAAAPLDEETRILLTNAVGSGRLSARGVHRVRCVARTIADLELMGAGVPPVTARHIRIAMALRDIPIGLGPGRIHHAA
jgi:magnesium chelatase family protein